MSKRFSVIFQKVLQFIKIDSIRIFLTGFNSDIGLALPDIFVNCLNNLDIQSDGSLTAEDAKSRKEIREYFIKY
jgi:hypothetical protein